MIKMFQNFSLQKYYFFEDINTYYFFLTTYSC